MAKIVLQTEGLTKSYDSLVAVKDLNLEVFQGEIFGFLGPNGAGKTTSINMICGLLKPDSGRTILDGIPISGGDVEARARVGLCPQEIVLWDRLTCIEQLQFIGEMYGLNSWDARQAGDRLLEILDLSQKRNAQAKALSSGMKRRLNLAMALVHDPDILVLDEPEAGLDPQSRVKVRELIRSLAKQKTVILTTQNMDEADRVADRVAIIDHGELLVLDTPEALKRSIGEGDVLEINLGGQAYDPQNVLTVLARFSDQADIAITGNILSVRSLDLVKLLPPILEALSLAGISCGEVRLRENTLEDVFIRLTGRRLRQ